MDNIFINIFNGVRDYDTSKKISVLDVIWKISEGEWKNAVERYRRESDKKTRENLKKNLPAVTFAGSLDGKGRLDENVCDYSGIVVCDIDKISRAKLSSYKNKLKQDGYVLAFFESPSYGLKVLIKVNSELKFHKSHAFRQIEEYMKYHHDIKIDPSGKNPSRLCFMSFDPDMYYNDEAHVFEVDTTIDYEEIEKRSAFTSVNQGGDDLEISNDSQHVFDTAVKWVSNSKTGSYHKGNRNNFIFHLSCLLNRAGMQQELAVAMIHGRYSSLEHSEIKNTVRSSYRHNAAEHGTKPIYRRQSNTNQQTFDLL
ncbi:MAG: BT4734/BF3469 family protein [Candidatus Hodarchaeales archaeon]